MNCIASIAGLSIALLALSTVVSLADEARCVQSGLNALGFDAGVVDGQVGPGTQTALAKFITANPGTPAVQLWENTMTEWCLYLSAQEGINDATRALAAPIEAQAIIRIRMKVDPKAVARVALMDADNKALVETTEFEIVTGDEPEVVASFPYSAGKKAIGICTMFAEGYGVLNTEGKTFKGSCDRQPIAFWLGTRTMQYNTAPMDAE